MPTKARLIGHRGMRGLLPENTLMGLRYCIDHRLSGVEFDVQFNKDGTPFVYHDLKLNTAFTFIKNKRVNRKDAVWFNGLDDEKVEQLRIGPIRLNSHYRWRFLRQRCRKFEKIPTLDAWLSEPNPIEDFIYLLEIKSRPMDWPDATSPAKQASLIAPWLKKHSHKNIIVESFDWRVIFELKKIFSGDICAPKFCLLSYQQSGVDNNISEEKWTEPYSFVNTPDISELIIETGIQIWAPYYADYSLQYLTSAKSKGLVIIPWTVNRRALGYNLLNQCDYIISDYPLFD